MLKRIGIGLMAAGVLAFGATASAQVNRADFKNASKYCKALRADMGGDAFKGAYGKNKNGRNAFGRCIAAEGGKHKRARLAALAECKDELALDPAAFLEKYRPVGEAAPGEDAGDDNEPAESEPADDSGDDDVAAARQGGTGDLPAVQLPGLRAALAHCVAQKVKTFVQERKKALRAAFKECKAQRGADPEGFRDQYGSNRNKRNALGKCVSQEAKAGATSP
jgi:hypothetical protein